MTVEVLSTGVAGNFNGALQVVSFYGSSVICAYMIFFFCAVIMDHCMIFIYICYFASKFVLVSVLSVYCFSSYIILNIFSPIASLQ
jgi:hypothetical protein